MKKSMTLENGKNCYLVEILKKRKYHLLHLVHILEICCIGQLRFKYKYEVIQIQLGLRESETIQYF